MKIKTYIGYSKKYFTEYRMSNVAIGTGGHKRAMPCKSSRLNSVKHPETVSLLCMFNGFLIFSKILNLWAWYAHVNNSPQANTFTNVIAVTSCKKTYLWFPICISQKYLNRNPNNLAFFILAIKLNYIYKV